MRDSDGAGEQVASIRHPLWPNSYVLPCDTFTRTTTLTELRGRRAESADSVDIEQFVVTLKHVRDDDRSRPKER